MSGQKIKTMKLYSAVERIHNDLAALGFSREDALDVRVLSGIDQLHYHGTDAVDAAARAAGIGRGSRVLDIGAGFGGPARWLADQHGAEVTAVELQNDFNALASDLTRRAAPSPGSVDHVQGDILTTPLAPGTYDAAVSWLAIYHIPAREALFPRLHAALKPGATLFVEDLYELSPPTPEVQHHLDGMMAAGTMQTRDAYVAELEAAGFTDVDFADHTRDWADFTARRLDAFRANRAAYVARQGEGTYAELDEFYEVAAGLLAGGCVGGVRLTARKR